MGRFATRALTLATIGVVFTGSVSVAAYGSDSKGLAGKSASQVLSMAVKAARHKGSFHLAISNFANSLGETSVFDIGRSQGEETVSSATEGNCTFMVFPNVLYFKADATWLETVWGISPSMANSGAGSWISVPTTNPDYKSFASGNTLASLSTWMPTAPLARTGARTVHGTRVIGVSGGVPNSALTEVLYVSTTAPYLPVELVQNFSSPSGQPGTTTALFSKWGEAVSLTPPSSAIPIPAGF